ncbi:MAG: UDP-N-acetylmuramate dehydrogenase [Patescibacteria group bacterium]
MIIQENITLAPYTVFKIGGQARYFCEAQNLDEIREALLFAKNYNVPFFVLGAGSNILASDDGFDGLIIKMNLRNLEFRKSDFLGKLDFLVMADAGVSMAQAVNFSVNQGLGGFEWAIGIPGTVGGSVFGNAGCFGLETKDIVESVNVLEVDMTNNCVIKELNNTECNFKYRHSIFKQHPEWIILGANLHLFPRGAEESKKMILEYTKKRIGLQDIGSQCAGCIFKNISPEKPSGLLIDQAGLKGTSVGGAMVSKKHGNYIINTGNATARDVKELVSIIKSKVKSFHGVNLEEEIRYL